VILTVSLFGGVLILETFGISFGALRIAGGLTVMTVGYRMLFEDPDAGALPSPAHRDIAFFPLAMPGISGPGSIATVIGIATEIAELKTGSARAFAYAGTVGSIVVTCFVILLTLHSAQYVSRLIGREGLNAATPFCPNFRLTSSRGRAVIEIQGPAESRMAKDCAVLCLHRPGND
jgi:multiple antibiotic resistance protein